VALRCLLVDDSRRFLDAASSLLGREGLEVVGTASTKAEALERVRELEPDLTIIDLELGGESGFDLAWELAASADGASPRTLLTSARGELEFSDVVAVTPSLGFIPKTRLSAAAIEDVLADRDHGGGFRHEAILYSSSEELAAATLPFMREGLGRGDDLLVILRDERRLALQSALGSEASRMAFDDVDAWYVSPDHALQSYRRAIGDRLERGVPRVRVVAEVVWPESSASAEIAAWKRYEATISELMASVPVSIVCAYNETELAPGIVADARRTHPVLRSVEGARPSAQYAKPGEFVRSLEPAGLSS
jgi:CheY-like chemotaxis protein